MRRDDLPGVVILESKFFADERGYFVETYNKSKFAEQTRVDPELVQDNESCSRLGVLRGLHYQTPPHVQGKLVRALTGTIFDVAVDLRQSSSTFGDWMGVTLNEEDGNQMWIPEGFAHGFLALSDNVRVTYKVTDFYAPDCQRTIRWDDETIGIDWPLDGIGRPILSTKDADAPGMRTADLFV